MSPGVAEGNGQPAVAPELGHGVETLEDVALSGRLLVDHPDLVVEAVEASPHACADCGAANETGAPARLPGREDVRLCRRCWWRPQLKPAERDAS